MCADRKQSVNAACAVVLAIFACAAPADAAPPITKSAAAQGTAGGIALGESHGGVTDQAYVIAPPYWLYVVERERGSFLDCGEGQEARTTDASGRDVAALSCGVTLTETIIIPAAAASARIIVHY